MPATTSRPPVDILVPIFNAKEEVVKCVTSVLNHADGDFRLILIDDASTDASLVDFLASLRGRDHRVLLQTARTNLGFVQSVNVGLRLAESRDVLLLNSDTIATPEFLARLQACAYSDSETGIVSPLSNNATICSVPDFCKNNPLPPDDHLDEVARLISATSLHLRPQIVTAVGFCMYIRRSVLSKIGNFDEIYGRGFGEENDFCERAKAAGFKIRLCDDVFIPHIGKASFGDEGFEWERRNSKVLALRFPNYLRDVADFCERNPLSEVQHNVRYQLERHETIDLPSILYLLHADPFRQAAGGSESHVLDLVRAARLPRVIIAYPVTRAVYVAEVRRGDIDNRTLHRYPLSEAKPWRLLADAELERTVDTILEEFGVGFIHIHHLLGWPVRVWRRIQQRKIEFAYTIHDYYSVCPNQHLLDFAEMRPCDCSDSETETAKCFADLKRFGGESVPVSTKFRHREEFHELLQHARAIIAPSQFAARRIKDAFAGVNFSVCLIPHGLNCSVRRVTGGPSSPSRRLRIGALGRVDYPSKGAVTYLQLARALSSALVEWHFFGDLKEFGFREDIESLRPLVRAFFHGSYARENAVKLLREAKVDVVVNASPSHETFCYTVSEALMAGIPVLALRRGALTERLEEAGLGSCLADDTGRLEQMLWHLTRSRRTLDDLKEQASRYKHPTMDECVRKTLALYPPISPSGVSTRSPATFRRYWAEREYREEVNNPLIDVEKSYPAFWYSTYLKLRPIIPGPLRSVVRNRVVEKKSEWQLVLRPQAIIKTAAFGNAVVSLQRGLFRISSGGDDPYIILPTTAASPDFLQIKLRSEGGERLRMQLFWTSSDGENFSEQKSFKIEVPACVGWQDVVIDLRLSKRSPSTKAIRHLRLDPLDRKGTIYIERITLGKFKAWALELLAET